MDNAFLAQAIQLAAIHLSVFYYLVVGKLDQHSLTLLVQMNLLVSGSQLIHLLKFNRRSSYRRVFVANTIATVSEFFVLGYGFLISARNLNLCPSLLEALSETRRQTQVPTLIFLILNFILSFFDVVISQIDRHRNKDEPRKRGEHSRRTLPAWLTWTLSGPQEMRRVYGIFGLFFPVFTIFTIECVTIQGFEDYVANVDGISTQENVFGFGQFSAVVVCLLSTGYAFRGFLLEVTKPFSKTAVCKRG